MVSVRELGRLRHTVGYVAVACIGPTVNKSKVKVTWLSDALPVWICMSI